MKFRSVKTGEGYDIEVWCPKNHANPFHCAGVIVKDHKERAYFVSSGEGVFLFKKDLNEIMSKM